MSKQEIIKSALQIIRKRFLELSCQNFAPELSERQLVMYRAKMLFDNTVLGGKNSRSSLSYSIFEALHPNAESDVKNIVAQAAATLEMIQAYYLIADDIMDQSITRRGKPTWFNTEGIGLSAINDTFLLDVGALEILQHLYPAHPQLNKICEAYHRSKKITVIGQLLDAGTQGKLKSFTWERYEQLVQYKTSHYTIFHPIEQALLICDILKGHSEIRKIAYRIGFLFQAQDDFLDVFGDPNVTGKIGTDLQDGKCTFVTTRAIEKLFKKEIPALTDFENNFGKKDNTSVQIVRNIIEDLRIKDEFFHLQKRMIANIVEDFKLLPPEVQPITGVLDDLLRKLENRNK